MGERKLGVLVNGAGWVSTQHIQAFCRNPHTEVVAISSRSLAACQKRAHEAGLEGIGLYDNYERALKHDGVDIVCVTTPQHLHAENTIAAAEAGKHIVIEKAIANNLGELKAMRSAVRSAGVRTVVSFVFRWYPVCEIMKAMIADDVVGDVYFVEADYQHYIASWWTGFDDARRKSTGVSALLTGGCHAVDAVRWLAATDAHKAVDAVEVFAYSGGYRKGLPDEFDSGTNRWHKAPSLEYDDLEICLIKLANGALAKVSANYGCVMPYAFPIEIFGNRGTIKDNRVWSHKFPGQKGWVEIPTVSPNSAEVAHHPFQGEIDHFVECILSKRESHCNLEDAIRTHEIIFGALQSHETNLPVKLPLLDSE